MFHDAVELLNHARSDTGNHGGRDEIHPRHDQVGELAHGVDIRKLTLGWRHGAKLGFDTYHRVVEIDRR